MFVLQIEHAVPDFEAWKRAFDSDPIGREESGVLRHTVLRPVDDPKTVVIELELRTVQEAEHLLARLRGLWGSQQGTLVMNPTARIAEVVETRE